MELKWALPLYQFETLQKLSVSAFALTIALLCPLSSRISAMPELNIYASSVLNIQQVEEIGLIANDELPNIIENMVISAVSKYPNLDAKSIAQTILRVSNEQGIDPILVGAVIQHESRFNSRAIGGHGEIGLMQIKPKTARWISRKTGLQYTSSKMLFDPHINIEIGVRYLAWLDKGFDDIRHTISAYNMGPNNVRRILGRGIVPNIYYAKVLENYKAIYRTSIANKKPRVSTGFTISFNK